MQIQRTTAQDAGILGIGAYRPHRVVTNEEVASRTGRTAEWIQRRTGIMERRYAAADETVVDMAVEAARKAVADAGVEPGLIGAVVLASMSGLRQSPGDATEIADRLGTRGAAFDLNAACAGFCYGLALAGSMVRDGAARYVVVIGSDKMTDIVDPEDPSAAILFADGAGAMVVGPREECGIGPVVWGSDGGRRELIAHSASWLAYRDEPGTVWPTMRMAGPEVFRWAIEEMPKVALAALDAAGTRPSDLAAFVPHQANLRMIETVAQRMELPEHVVVARDVVHTGNTSAASVPLAVARLRESGAVTSGDLALFLGFGAGLTWGAQVVRLP
ncbi:3-oxoacyl-ACP synthase [Streptomyces eurocidicus]|uniref:3-oxoacyl-ACP synthase n=1 Tax=Streptomyces eurocidicus TaxID=66423 RepID=A0A2N8NZI0_STREU|nr:beta-ketoacyl-ACP synthase III [Streptomyces eurocidicus]MBB5120892.1 3-oxoacyl-[acyl-carrier-protein] synthase-3 [Streptomyces eurocidicus]PNE34178.1 3-oxoacyl-ACP synthase [Streptomyces eurocidicus]